MPDRGVVKAFLESTTGEWVLILSLVFGGCCSSVSILLSHFQADDLVLTGTYGLSKLFSRIIRNQVRCSFQPLIQAEGRCTGTFLTFAQFVYVTIQNLSSQLYFPPRSVSSTTRVRLPRFRKREVPIRRWMVQVVLFVTVSLSELCPQHIVEY